MVAEPGDGVFSLLRKYGVDPKLTLSDFLALNENRLGGGNSLFEGSTYLIPVRREVSEAVPVVADEVSAVADAEASAPPAYASYDIFGPDYAEVRPESARLENTVFYLISGHGGPDPGAMTRYGEVHISEDEYAYDVTLRLAR